jgi:GNAT superfamily N-acetyltransferase
MGACRQRSERHATISPVRMRAVTEDDLGAVSALLGTAAAYVRSDWKVPSFDLRRDAWIAEDGGRAVGYAAVTAGERLAHVAADPGVADALLAAAVARARERGFGRLRIGGESGLVRRPPFELETETLAMQRPLSEPIPVPEWPPGIAVRTFEPADGAAVHRLLDDAYRAWDSRYVPIAHDDWLRWMTGDIDFDPTVWWLAERDGDLVGCALHWRSGWLKDLAARSSERGRGLGAALVLTGLAEFARRGTERVGLKVDAANPTAAVSLYERLGFAVERWETTWALTL